MIFIQYVLLILLCGSFHCLQPINEEMFPVQVSLHSNLDNRVDNDSQELELSPTKQHPRSSSLKETNFIKEEKMKLTDDRQLTFTQERKQDLKLLKRSKRDVEEEIEELIEDYKTEKVKQCCRDGHNHFEEHRDCYHKLQEMKKEQKPHCYKAFEKCCQHTFNYYTKISFMPTTPSYCVSLPKFWKVGEPQKVGIYNIIALWSYKTNYHIKISLLSYPDQKVTYDSQELQWNSADTTKEVAMSLRIKLEDLPKGDELEKFVYLVTLFNGDVHEKRVPLLDLRVIQQDLKKPKGSPDELNSEIETLANKYPTRKLKRTCRDAYYHYTENLECQSKLIKFEEEEMWGLYRAFQKCCLHAREYSQRLAYTKPELYNIRYAC